MDVSLKPIKKEVKLVTPTTLPEKVADLELKLAAMSKMFYRLRKSKCNVEDRPEAPVNNEGIPIDSHYIGFVRGVDLPYVLRVNDTGDYSVGETTFKSLSAAAEAVSGVRRSGWAFWHDFSGKTLKELYK